MFIRIVRGKNESLYECERMHIRPHGDTEFVIEMEPSGVNIQIDKTVPAALAVYVMNNNGRTIDTIFRKEPDGDGDA
jgi:hypothetical protein